MPHVHNNVFAHYNMASQSSSDELFTENGENVLGLVELFGQLDDVPICVNISTSQVYFCLEERCNTGDNSSDHYDQCKHMKKNTRVLCHLGLHSRYQLFEKMSFTGRFCKR